MKKLYVLGILILAFSSLLSAQDEPVQASFITSGLYHGLSQPLRDLPAMTPEEYEKMESLPTLVRNMERKCL